MAVHETLSHEFRQYLTSREDWFACLEDYRHALAHRIPLYIAPCGLSPSKLDEHNGLEKRKNDAYSRRDYELWLTLDLAQERLGRFRPLMMHSFSQGAVPVNFHAQVLADWNTIAEIAERFLQELHSRSVRPSPNTTTTQPNH